MIWKISPEPSDGSLTKLSQIAILSKSAKSLFKIQERTDIDYDIDYNIYQLLKDFKSSILLLYYSTITIYY